MSENKLLFKDTDGKLSQIQAIAGLDVLFSGENSRVIIEAGCIFNNTKISIASNSLISISKTGLPGINGTSINMAGSPNSTLVVGEGLSVWGCLIEMANEKDQLIEIGHFCMFSSGITIRSTDGHTIIDKATNTIINHTSPICIGDHVWIGADATILKGSLVSNNSIVATCAVVTKKFFEENIIIAGNPAKKVKENIHWDRRYIERYIAEENISDTNVGNNSMEENISSQTLISSKIFGVVFYPFINNRQRKKLKTNPISFFRDSKNLVTCAYGRLFRIL